MDARFSGSIEAAGRRVEFKDAPGQQTHIWGSKHALRWAWGHCNAFKEDPGAVWEGLDSQIKLGPLTSPHLKVFYLKTGGREYLFNAVPLWIKNKSDWRLGRWTFEAKTKEIRIKGEVSSRPEGFVGVTYADPDGGALWCNNSKVADIRISLFGPKGERLGELTSEKGCALEFVDRRTYPEVPIRI